MLDHIRWEDILSVSVSLTYLSGRVTLSVTVRVALPSLDSFLLFLMTPLFHVTIDDLGGV